MLLIISLLGPIAGCWHKDPLVRPEPVVQMEYIRPDCGSPPKRDVVELRVTSWQVREGRFCLSAQGYEDLSYNVSEIWKGVRQLKTEIEYYEHCLEDFGNEK